MLLYLSWRKTFRSSLNEILVTETRIFPLFLFIFVFISFYFIFFLQLKWHDDCGKVSGIFNQPFALALSLTSLIWHSKFFLISRSVAASNLFLKSVASLYRFFASSKFSEFLWNSCPIKPDKLTLNYTLNYPWTIPIDYAHPSMLYLQADCSSFKQIALQLFYLQPPSTWIRRRVANYARIWSISDVN